MSCVFCLQFPASALTAIRKNPGKMKGEEKIENEMNGDILSIMEQRREEKSTLAAEG